MRYSIVFSIFCLVWIKANSQVSVRYDLFIRDTVLSFSGTEKHAIAVNGQIPMPTLTFTEGDTAIIYVHNEMDVETSLHWHGVFLPNSRRCTVLNAVAN